MERISRKEEYQALTGEAGACNHENLTRLQNAVASVIKQELTKRQREILDLYYFQNKGVEEIAFLLDIHKSTVSRTKQRALDKVKRFLQYYDFR